VGGHAHGPANIEALAHLGLGNFVWMPKVGDPIGSTPWDAAQDIMADARTCADHGLYFMISQRRGLGTVVRPGGFEYGGDCSGDLHTPATVGQIRAIGGDRFVGLYAEELDADLVQSALRPSFRTRTPGLYDFTDRAGGRASFERELAGEAAACHSERARYLPNLCVTHHLSGFRAGADIVLGELFEHLPTTEFQLAYLRGGASKQGAWRMQQEETRLPARGRIPVPWGVWVSPWFWGQVPC
jgi:hypothetical protein